MVKNGHALVEERAFQNPSRPRLGVETLRLADLAPRITPAAMNAPHRLDFHQLLLTTRGRGSMTVDFETHECRPGTVIHVRPGQVQRLPSSAPGSRPRLDGVMVLFTSTFLSRPGLIAGLGTDVWQVSGSARTVLQRSFDELSAEYHSGGATDPEGVELLRHLLAVVLLRIARLPRPVRGEREVPAGSDFGRFQVELERSFATTRAVADYAARLGWSPRTLTRLSLAATGRTAKDVITERVVLEAKRLLAHTDQPVTAIASALGFSEATNFVKYFHAATGRTPSAFRAEQLAPG